ncbi:MAG: FtsX-like permease family protein [Deltaproteobacteria bacterium]|nr:FtsX-like permease family protein [Deltaproteobacteria bacterium]
MGGVAQLRLMVVLGLRSLWTHKVKTLTVGSLLFFGTFLVVVGTALLDSIESSMARSITASLAGHIQLYDADAKDPLALFGSGFMGSDDIGEIPDFAPVKAAVSAVPNVAAVVPMGIGMATISTPVELDQVFLSLREAVRDKDQARIDALAKRTRAIATDLVTEYANRAKISTDTERIAKAQADLARVLSDAFWKELEDSPELSIQFLDSHIAPLASDGRLVYLRYLGTDLDAFTRDFDRFQIVEGEEVPSGHRGMLLSKTFYEKQLKHAVARSLDRIRDKRVQGTTIAGDALLRTIARELPKQYQRITYQLDPADAGTLEGQLRELLPQVEGGLPELVQAFLAVDDANFDARYAAFYELIAPHIKLYEARPGDVITLRAFTKGGYLKSVNVRVFGVFRFSGLETSDMAGAQNLVDMMTFRELYGQMTPDKRAELADIKAKVGIEDIDRASAEDALFGGGALVEEHQDDEAGFDEFRGVDLAGQVERLREEAAAPFDQTAVDNGLALNAAVLLKDPERLDESLAAIREALDAAHLRVQATDWQSASGMVGQFITVVRLVLYIAIFIIFLVALVIINNSMIIATMERVAEIGTMRAIGARRRFVLVMFLFETGVLALLSGGLGGAAGIALITALGHSGISAGGVDIMVFLFSGPFLYPSAGIDQLLLGVTAIIVASLASTLYPALIATRIQPVVAMQQKE